MMRIQLQMMAALALYGVSSGGQQVLQAQATGGHTFTTSGSATMSVTGQATSTVPMPSAAPQQFGGPNVGDVAPDFTFNGQTRYGALRDSMKLSDLRGQTVVLAFFPGARTQGCTIQMEKYRDSYGTVFRNGAGVVVIGMSVDPDTALASWAHDAHFPMLFASDASGKVGTLYGAYSTTYKRENRLLYVIGPDGKVTYVAKPFNVSLPASYSDLQTAVQNATQSAPVAKGQ